MLSMYACRSPSCRWSSAISRLVSSDAPIEERDTKANGHGDHHWDDQQLKPVPQLLLTVVARGVLKGGETSPFRRLIRKPCPVRHE